MCIRDSGIAELNESGIAGATVKIVNDLGAAQTLTTDEYGYFRSAVVAGTAVRIEVTKPSNLTGLHTTVAGNSTIKVLPHNASGEVVNVGFQYPSEFCQNNAYLGIPCYARSNPVTGEPALSVINSTWGQSTALPSGLANWQVPSAPITAATYGEIGTTWAVSYTHLDVYKRQEYCWADYVLEAGIYAERAYPCYSGPMLRKVDEAH